MVGGTREAHDRGMTEKPPTGPLGPEPGDTPSPPPTVGLPTGWQLQRSRDNRVVAGVAGGLGEATGVDPIVFRVLAVVLTFFGGVGVLLYALGWLLLPESDTGASVADRALGRRGGGTARTGTARTGTVALAIGLVVVAAIGIGAVVGNASATLLVLLTIGGLWLLLRRDDTAAAWGGPAPSSVGAPVGAAGASGPGAPAGPYATFGDTPPPPPRKRRPPSVLGPLTWSLALIGLGALVLADFAGADIAFAAYPALALAIVGLGLLVGTWYGRSRGLIALGLVLAFGLGIGTVADVSRPYGGRLANHHISFTDVGQIRPTYDFGFGRTELDMSAVNFQERTIRTHIDMGVGELRIVVPRNVDVIANVQVGVGESDVFDRYEDGNDVHTQLRDDGPDGRGGGELELNIDQGLGRVEVRREAA
jgi:phage shock protein PspC (stress-responsive transcriptional regulator)